MRSRRTADISVLGNYCLRCFGILLLVLFWAAIAQADQDTTDFEADFDIARYQERVPAPDFAALGLGNNEYRLQDYRDKFILLNFWASWCLPCVRELPELEKLRQALPESDFRIVAINVRDPESRLRKLLSSKAYNFDIPLDKTGEIYQAYGVVSFPTSFLIDRQGMLYGRINGARYWMKEGFVDYMKKLIEKESR